MTQSEPIYLLRLPEVINRLGISKSTLYNMITEGTFPSPIKMGRKTSVFPEHELITIQEAIIRGDSDENIKELVLFIQEKRKKGLHC